MSKLVGVNSEPGTIGTMFHTFESSKQTEDGGPASARRSKARTRACQPCRKRKIRCDGEKPCGACKWYRKPKECSFDISQAPQGLPKRYESSLISET